MMNCTYDKYSEKQMDHQESIHIALAIWNLADNYNRHAAVTIVSLLKNCSSNVVIHLLHDEKFLEIDPDGAKINRDKYSEISRMYGATIYYHNVTLPMWMNEISGLKIYSPGSIYRIYLPDILTFIDKVLYLDCDIVFNRDASELYNLDLTNLPLAARRWELRRIISICVCNKMQISKEEYFNSGVILFNLKYIREHCDLVSELHKFLIRYPYSRYPDQDFLNFMFQKNYYVLDLKYNFPSQHTPDSEIYRSVIHYESANSKPWIAYHGAIDDPYWQYLSETPWGENAQLLVKYARDAPDRQMLMASIFQCLCGYPIKKQIVYLYNLSFILWLKLIWSYFKILSKIVVEMRCLW